MPIRGKGDDDEIDSDGEKNTNAGTEDSIDVVEEEDENGTGDDNNDEDEVHGSSFWLQKWYNDEDEKKFWTKKFSTYWTKTTINMKFWTRRNLMIAEWQRYEEGIIL